MALQIRLGVEPFQTRTLFICFYIFLCTSFSFMPTSQTELSALKKLCPSFSFNISSRQLSYTPQKSLNDTWVSRKVPSVRLDGKGFNNVSSSGENW